MSFLQLKYSRQCLKLAVPVMITQVGQVTVNLFDSIIVGNELGADALASVSLANAIFFSFFVLAIGFSYAIPPLVSEADGRKDSSAVMGIFKHGYVINLLLGLALCGLIFLLKPLLYSDFVGLPAKLIPDTDVFLSIITISLIPIMIFQTYREFAEGLGLTSSVTKATIWANVINIVLNYVFIKGLWGFAQMGVAGSGYATLLSRLFMLLFIYIALRKNSKTQPYLQQFSLKLMDYSRKTFVKMLKLGFPTAMQLFFEVTAFCSAAFICAQVSATDVSSHQIALSMASFTFNLCLGFGVAATVMVGRKLGEKRPDEIKAIGINILQMVFLFMLVAGLFFVAFREILPTYFTKPDEIAVIQLASKLLIIAALFQLSDGIQVVALGCLRGIQDVKIPSYITFVAYWLIAIPLGAYLCIYQKMGAYGVWIGLGLGLSISAVLLVWRFLKLAKKMA
jgi:multidrug resistance protein, MATE family